MHDEAGVREGAVTVGGVRLAYLRSGAPDAPPMVLLHGLGENAAGWAPVAARFAAHFRVYAFDLRGHGASDWPGSYSFELMRDDVLGALDQLGLDRVTLAGHSMGGAVAYLVAMAQPDRIDRLIIEDVPLGYRRDRPVPDRPDTPVDFDWPVVPVIIRLVNSGEPDAWARLGSITADTLLIGGGPDSHIPQHKLADVAAGIPRCEIVTIPAGHNVHAARPDEFARAVLDWVRR